MLNALCMLYDMTPKSASAADSHFKLEFKTLT